MSVQIKKRVSGPFTVNADEAPGVSFVSGDQVIAAVALGALPPDIVTRLAVHGLSQKVGDSYAGAAAEESPFAYAVSAIKETIKQLVDGDWRVTAAGGVKATLLARALARATGQSLEDSMAVLQDKEDSLPEDEYKAFLKALRSDAAIKQASATIRLEDAARAAEKAKGATGGSDLASLFAKG